MNSQNNTPHDFPSEPVAWLNGRFCSAATASLPLTDLGLHGVAVTEMARTYDQDPFRLLDHLRRLQNSADAVGIQLDAAALEDVVRQMLAHNFAFTSSELGVILFATAGGNPTYLGREPGEPTVGAHTFELPLKRWARSIQDGVHLVVPEVRQMPDECVPTFAKTRSRMHWHLASRAASKLGGQAILVTADGFLTETAAANFFAVYGESVVTPAADVLPGISRDVVRDLCPVLGLRYEERNIRPEDIATADEAFLSSTPYGLMPVTRFEHKDINGALPGPVFFELCNAWSELVGIDIIDQIISA